MTTNKIAKELMWTTTNNSAEFWEDVFGHQVVDVAHQYKQWACTQNQNLLEHDSLSSLHKQITKAISSSLKKVMHKTIYGSCFWEKLSKNELELFVTKLNTCCMASETVHKPRKKCSDAGTIWKCKAPAGGKENVQLQKMAHSSHRCGLPKSVEIISTSDEEDSEDA
ncbi:hypothetical protein F5141DRAFT_1063657 [Pisolithus sp. B1]|nr:hypothetical protein F5141DRAFT_1063657 [Pisolithus sp. B1]